MRKPSATRKAIGHVAAPLVPVVIWSLMSGCFLGLMARVGTDAMGKFAAEVLHEQFVPRSIDLLIAMGATILGLCVAIQGRFQNPSYIRRVICFGAINVAVNFAATIFALAAGFSLVNLDNPEAHRLFALTIFLMVFYVGALVCLLAGSFRDVFTHREHVPRLVGLVMGICALPLFLWQYFA